MRRLWAYVISVVSALLLVTLTFSTVFLNMDSNLEYSYGKEQTFRISMKEEEDELPSDPNDSTYYDAIDNIAEVMSERLETADITAYTLEKVGNDTIKVAYSETTDDHYDMIAKYLTFNGTLALTTDGNEWASMEEFMDESESAYVDTDEDTSLPQIVIPVDNTNQEFLAVIEAAKTQLEDAEAEAEAEADEDSEAEEVYVYIYLWYDFEEDVDSYEAAQNDENMAEKILIAFDISTYNVDDDGLYPDEITATINCDFDEDDTVTVAELEEGYYRAAYYVNLINAGELDYEVELLYTNYTDAIYESLTAFSSMNEYVAFSRTILATIICFLIVSLLLVAFYRLGALSVIGTTAVSVFGAIGFIIVFNLEFNTAAIFGIVGVALASLASGIVYLSKLKDEAYKGRSLKKANAEASKKSTLPIVDINVVGIILGVFTYLIGGTLMEGFSAAIALGCLVSLLCNTIALKGLMWLATNTTKLQGKYEVFAIDSSKVPNITDEEKQTYFGSFADKDFTKKKKPVGIVGAVLLVASIAGMITFGLINDGNFYNTGSTTYENSEIYFEATDNQYAFTENSIQRILNQMYVIDSDGNIVVDDNGDPISIGSYVESIDAQDTQTVYIYEEKGAEPVEELHYFYVVTLDRNLDYSTEVQYTDSTNYVITGTVNEVFEQVLEDQGVTNSTASLKQVVVATEDYPGFTWITLATFTGIAVCAVYLMLRYRISRGLSTFLMTCSVCGITMGVFCLTRIVTSTYILAMLPVVALGCFIMEIFFMNKEREMVVEDRTRDNSLDHRKEIMTKATSYSFSYVVIFLVLAIYLAIDFYGFGPTGASLPYIFLLVGILLGALFITTLFGPLSHWFTSLFKKMTSNRKPRKKKKQQGKPNKSAEPVEATFIGIND